MSYDFTQTIDRKNTDSLKWDGMEPLFGKVPDDTVSMWIADMDFPSPKEVLDAMHKAVEFGIFGYPIEDDSCAKSTVAWLERRHNWAPSTKCMVTIPGVMSGVTLLIDELTAEGDGVVVQSPIYTPFLNSIRLNKRTIVYNPLIEPTAEDPCYRIDFDNLRECFQNGARCLLMSSPHNPAGRVWTREELTQIADLCQEFDVAIIADEIHHDMILKGYTHTVMATISEDAASRTYTCVSASKTFNFGGLPLAQLICPTQDLAIRMRSGIIARGLGHGNMMAMVATKAAQASCDYWIDALLEHIESNRLFTIDYFAKHLPAITMSRQEGTYMAWLNCRATGLSSPEIMKLIAEHAVILNDGAAFGPGGEQHLRLNLATSQARLEEGLRRLVEAFKGYC
ncbi:MAG: MalY/PatB family protein [Pseudomonadota bacterium]